MGSHRAVVGLLLAGLTLLAGCGLRSWQPAQPPRIPRIGYLFVQDEPIAVAWAFRQGLRELGYAEGQSIAVEWRFWDGRPERLPGLAAQLVGLNPDLIVVAGLTAALAVRDAAGDIPIVVILASADPVQAGLVAGLARPGGNVTGLSGAVPVHWRKRLELLRQIIPGASRFAVLGDTRMVGRSWSWDGLGRSLSVHLHPLELGAIDEPDSASNATLREYAGVIASVGGTPDRQVAQRIADLSLKHRLPSMSDSRRFVDAGGLMAYSPEPLELHRRSAGYVDKILRGSRPGDLPVEPATTFDFVINLQAARALGVPIPPSVLAQATELTR